MAADGNAKMNAVLEIPWRSEMRKDVIAWVQGEKDILKLFPKKVMTYSQKVELNTAKWSEAKLKKALPPTVRMEMKQLANRVSDAMILAKKAKSPKEHNKVLAAVKKAIAVTQTELEEKCSTLLEELESGKADAKAGLAQGKKAMAEVNKLKAEKVFSEPLEIAIKSAQTIAVAEDKAKDIKAAQDKAKTEIDAAMKSMGETAKVAQSVAKFLSTQGKKMSQNPKGEVATFGKKVLDKKIMDPLQQLDKNIDKLEQALTPYAKALKSGQIDGGKAKRFASEFDKMKSLQKSADSAVAAMKGLQDDFKRVVKDLK